jgi:hypothetical protein
VDVPEIQHVELRARELKFPYSCVGCSFVVVVDDKMNYGDDGQYIRTNCAAQLPSASTINIWGTAGHFPIDHH